MNWKLHLTEKSGRSSYSVFICMDSGSFETLPAEYGSQTLYYLDCILNNYNCMLFLAYEC